MAQVWAGRRYREEGMGKGGREREGGEEGKGREGGGRGGREGGKARSTSGSIYECEAHSFT